MPLLDHFHPPLCHRRHWEGFHGLWASSISDVLNEELLPPEYFAEFQVTVGARIEVDVGTFNEPERPDAGTNGAFAGVQTLAWAPPAPAATILAVFPDDLAVHVFSTLAGPTLVAAIELISRRTRTGKRHRGPSPRSVIVVDIATSCRTNLHDELAALLGHKDALCFAAPTPIYATAYRPANRQERNEIEVWRETLALGQPLPTLPLAVRGLGFLPIDLESTYMAARKRGRID